MSSAREGSVCRQQVSAEIYESDGVDSQPGKDLNCASREN
jgi:hypothetical protein